jgi:Putative 3TM holin, Phage_holin_3
MDSETLQGFLSVCVRGIDGISLFVIFVTLLLYRKEEADGHDGIASGAAYILAISSVASLFQVFKKDFVPDLYSVLIHSALAIVLCKAHGNLNKAATKVIFHKRFFNKERKDGQKAA